MAWFHHGRTQGVDVRFSLSDVLDALESETEQGFTALRDAVGGLGEAEAKAALANLVWHYREHKAKAIAAQFN